MNNNIYKLLVVFIILQSCGVSNKLFDKKQYRKSEMITTYSGMANEFQDGYLVLKENNYFQFYQKTWIIINLKQGDYVGRYYQSNDTVYLNWLGTNPKKIKYYMSNKCIVDSATKSLWFVDEVTGEKLWGLNQRYLKSND